MDYQLLPRFLQVELTYGCNSACTFCYNPNHRRQVDDSVRFRILHAVNDYAIDHVQLIGGEVTILPQLPAYLDALDQVRWKSIVTNGRIFVPEIIGKVDEIYLSLHGDATTHETITRAEGSFKVIEESIRGYVGAGIEVHSDTVLTKRNADQVFDIAAHAQSLGMSSLFLNIYQPAGLGARLKNDLSPSIEQIRGAITQMLAAREELGFQMQFGTSTPFCLDERLVTHELAFVCGTGDWFASIDPWGELRICNQSKRSYGNMLDEPLGKIWHKQEIANEYRDLSWMGPPCGACEFRNDCLGGCRIGDDGAPRLDPIVQRDADKLVSPERLTELRQIYETRSYDQPYV